MLPKKQRINRDLFQLILKEGKRYHSPHLFLTVADALSGQNTPSRFAFSISKKVLKNATERNKCRRRGYFVIARHKLSITSGFLCLFSFKKGAGAIAFPMLEKEIIDLLSLAHIIQL